MVINLIFDPEKESNEAFLKPARPKPSLARRNVTVIVNLIA
jgi:hypothetical protein